MGHIYQGGVGGWVAHGSRVAKELIDRSSVLLLWKGNEAIRWTNNFSMTARRMFALPDGAGRRSPASSRRQVATVTSLRTVVGKYSTYYYATSFGLNNQSTRVTHHVDGIHWTDAVDKHVRVNHCRFNCEREEENASQTADLVQHVTSQRGLGNNVSPNVLYLTIITISAVQRKHQIFSVKKRNAGTTQ